MTSASETGHAKNLANFNEMISFVTSLGTVYNPSKNSIKLTALKTLASDAAITLTAVNSALPVFSNAVVARENAFAPLSKLVTRVINSLRSTDTSPQTDESARFLVRKLQGTRTSAKLSEEEKAALVAEGKETREISSSQMSFDSRLDNFDKLVKLLASIPLYTPNELELQVVTLTALYNDLKTKNTAVVDASMVLYNARTKRNVVFYKPNTGFIDLAVDVKNYIKSLYGATSPQYKQVSRLEFKAAKKL